MKTYYKIVDIDSRGNYRTLYHNHKGSQILPTNIWLNATKKKVRDSSRGKNYLSGFHLLADKEKCEKYFGIFKKSVCKKEVYTRRIIPVLAKNVRFKEHSPWGVCLADEIYIQE